MELNVTLLVQFAIFMVALAWLSLVLFRPMLRLLDERENRIQGARHEAQQLASQGGDKAQLIQQKLDAARSDALEERNRLRQQGQKSQSEAIEAARKLAQQRLATARTEIEGARSQAAKTLQTDADTIAGLIVERMVDQRPGGQP